MGLKPLEAERLRLVTDPARLPFETTESLLEPLAPVGQARAMRALHFGAGMAQPGYNIFVTGPQGCGKRSAVKRALEILAAAMPTPLDVAYVFNFEQSHRPRVLQFGPGDGARFRDAMADFVVALTGAMPKLFGSDDYLRRRNALEQEFHSAAHAAIDALRRDAESHGLALVELGQGGFDFRAMRDGLPMSDQDYRTLPLRERERLTARAKEFRTALEDVTQRLEALRLGTLDKIRTLDRELGRQALRALIVPLEQRFIRHREAHAWLEGIQNDVLAQCDALQAMARAEGDDRLKREGVPFHRYEVNLIVDRADAKGAPVVSLGLPALSHLVGKVEHITVLMTLVSDFRHIQAGALHHANGGFLLIDALDLVRQEASWEALKRALKGRRIKIESLSDLHDRTQAVSIQPEAVPLDVKIVLFGEAWVYQRLAQIDAEFSDLFKVQADFALSAPRDDTNCTDLLAAMAAMARNEGLKQLDRGGAARLIDEASRLTGDAEKISIRTARLADLLREGDHYAALSGRSLVSADDIARAVTAKDDRAGRLKALEHELVQRRIVFIDTEGARAGQVNGLTVLSAAGFSFGMPARITAQVAPGEGRIIDIERVAQFSGPSHVKGVQILSGYLNGMYATGRPLSISASIAFEQSYGPIDGDSASAAELIAVLSAIAGVPVRQGLAITGSIDQYGRMQPIGGANEKIEGFFDVCAARGLRGQQGVIVPKANVAMLMLRDEVVEAARLGLFSVYAVETVDEAIAILTGMRPGERRGAGGFAHGTFNRRVQDRLIDFARPRLLKPVRLDPWWRL